MLLKLASLDAIELTLYFLCTHIGGLNKTIGKKTAVNISKSGKPLTSLFCVIISNTFLIIETTEPHFTLPPSLSEKESQNENEENSNDEQFKKTESIVEASVSVIEMPHHLNGSLKMSTSSKDSKGKEDPNNKTNFGIIENEEEEPHSLWKWPARRSKLAKVS